MTEAVTLVEPVTTAVVRTVQRTRGPRLGQRVPVTHERIRVGYDALLPHPDVHRCAGCDRPLLSRLPAAVFRRHGPPSCSRCPVSGVILANAEAYPIPGFTPAAGEIATRENGAPIHAESLRNARGFSGTSRRGGRPRLSEAERRARARDRKRLARERQREQPGEAAP